jgi:hypothetical protein
MSSSRATTLLLASLLAIGAGLAPPLPAQERAPAPIPKRWSGSILVPKTDLAPEAYDRFELQIFAVTDEKEKLTLLETLRSGGQGALRNAMFALEPKGWISIGNSRATSIGVIRVLDRPEGGRIVRVFSDYPLRLLDQSDPAGSALHPFGFMELTVDAKGVGEGRLVAAASLTIKDGDLAMQSAGAPVFSLVEVKAESPPR